jgi:hypothetical protein
MADRRVQRMGRARRSRRRDDHGTRPPAVLSKAKAPGHGHQQASDASEENDTRRPVLSLSPRSAAPTPTPTRRPLMYYALTTSLR